MNAPRPTCCSEDSGSHPTYPHHLTSHVSRSPLNSHLSPLTSYLSPLTSTISTLTSAHRSHVHSPPLTSYLPSARRMQVELTLEKNSLRTEVLKRHAALRGTSLDKLGLVLVRLGLHSDDRNVPEVPTSPSSNPMAHCRLTGGYMSHR